MEAAKEELEILGFLGMCGESMKIISSYKKIFFQIFITLILPLSVVFLSHSEISKLVATKIILDFTRISLDWESFDVFSIGNIGYSITQVVYSTFLFGFSLLSTSVVVYTVACVYSHKPITYDKVVRFAFKIWNKLMITLICNFSILIAHNILTITILTLVATHFQDIETRITRATISTIYAFYFVGFVYIGVIWQISSIVSMLEKSNGFRAIAKSMSLIEGKMGISAAIFLEVNLCLGCIHVLFDKFVVFEENSYGLIGKVGFGVLFLVLRSLVFLFGLVAQTVVYFACKASFVKYDYSQIYLGSYVALDSIIVVQIEQPYKY